MFKLKKTNRSRKGAAYFYILLMAITLIIVTVSFKAMVQMQQNQATNSFIQCIFDIKNTMTEVCNKPPRKHEGIVTCVVPGDRFLMVYTCTEMKNFNLNDDIEKLLQKMAGKEIKIEDENGDFKRAYNQKCSVGEDMQKRNVYIGFPWITSTGWWLWKHDILKIKGEWVECSYEFSANKTLPPGEFREKISINEGQQAARIEHVIG